MDHAKIALARRISSDSIDSFGVQQNARPLRKGKRKGFKKNTKTNIADIKGEDLRAPLTPQAEGPRHSDRAPNKQVRVLRDDSAVGGRSGKKRSLRGKQFRRTRSLSPQTGNRIKGGSSDLLTWKPVDLLSVAVQAGLRNKTSESKEEGDEGGDNDESSLGSLIDAIEAEFGGQQQIPIYHQSTSSMPAVPIYTSDEDQPWELRFSPDADVLLSLSSVDEDEPVTDTPVSIKSSRKPSLGKDSNNASLGTLSTATSTLSNSMEDAVMDLFSALKPSSTQDKPDPPTSLRPPSLHKSKAIPEEGGKSSPKKKKPSRKKDTAASVASDDSQWLEFVTPLGPSQNQSSASTVGDVKAYKTDSTGTIDSMNSEEVKRNLEKMGGKSLSALDIKQAISPTRKKDLLRVSTHCSPTQVSKHAGLSVMSAHTSSSSSAYLLERLPLEPPLTKKTRKKGKTRSLSPKKIKKESAASVDKSIEEFDLLERAQKNANEDSEAQACEVSGAKSPRRTKRPSKSGTNVIANTLAIMSSDPAASERLRKAAKPSDASADSIELFTPVAAPKQAVKLTDSSTKSDKTTVPPNDPDVAPTAKALNSGLVSAESDVQSDTSSGIFGPTYLPTTAAMTNLEDSEQRRNPPARPWSGIESFSNESFVSSIQELSSHEVEEESMLNVLITSLKKELPDLENSAADNLEQSDVNPSLESSERSDDGREPVAEALVSDQQNPQGKKKGKTKPTKTGKKIRLKANPAKSSKVVPADEEQNRTEPVESMSDASKPVRVKSSSQQKSPNGNKSPLRPRSAIDTSVVPNPPLTNGRSKTPPRAPKADAIDGESAPQRAGINSQRRRGRSKKPRELENVVTEMKAPKTGRQGDGDDTGGPRRKTPTRTRATSQNESLPVRKKTPTKTRPKAERDIVSGMTPARNRAGVEDANAVTKRKMSSRRLDVSSGTSNTGKQRTPTRTRPKADGEEAQGERQTPKRTRPVASVGEADGGARRKTPTRTRLKVDGGDVGSAGRKKTPTKTRLGADSGSKKVTPTRTRPESTSTQADGDTRGNDMSAMPTTPTEKRKAIRGVTGRKQSPTRVRKVPDLTETAPSIVEQSAPVVERAAPDPPAMVHRNESRPTVPDPPAATHGLVTDSRSSTPTRVRRIVGAAADRVVAACRTPPRERKGLNAVSDVRRIRERSFSPFSRARQSLSRTPPRNRISEEVNESRPTRRKAVSQSPPRERLRRNFSGSLSPLPARPRTVDDSTPRTSEIPERPSSRGRRRPSAADSKASSDIENETSRTTTPTRTRRGVLDSEALPSSRPRTPSRRRRKIGEGSQESASAEMGPNRTTKTPTRLRRGSRNSIADDANEIKKEDAPIVKATIRPRRRGAERDSSSGTTLSEKATLALEALSNSESPRGRPKARGRTPTKTRRGRTAHGKDMRAPDPPGDNRSKLRAQSAQKPRTRSLSRSRSKGNAMIASASMHQFATS